MPTKMKVLLVLLVATAGPAHAITGKFQQDFEHPFVGLAVFYDQSGAFSHRCSGSLLTPTVFLTAGHCVAGVSSARVYFQQDAGAHYDPATQLDPVSGYPESCAPGTEAVCTTGSTLFNYGYGAFGLPDTHDAGLVILDHPIALAGYGALAQAGSLDPFATQRGLTDVTFTASGYGLSYTNPAITVSYRERLMAVSHLVNLTSALTGGFNLQTTNNPGIGGGTCFGDSGGPIFFGETTSNTIVGVTSFGLSANVCAGVDFSYRTDRTDVIDWILATVPADQASLVRIVAVGP